ncbi:DUF4336 domain-containing protein [Ottowia thiooxydans]|uniref:DUF4336 domain-containing protein n=1 Tax=Ottowia thiooxydans TaxID=219182 RepID=UPI00040E69D7|nr:DUF4336 domain-containing protein [Ottowia thiooxydans]
MLQPIDTNIWHAVHSFTANGLPITTRMTVVRLPDRKLFVHSPIPLDDETRLQLDALGRVAFIVAPNLFHHLFLGLFSDAYPEALVYGPAGLRKKRPDLQALRDLPTGENQEWEPDLEHLTFEGIPAGRESIWFHRPTGTLIVTDLVQWWQGKLRWTTQAYAILTGVRHKPAVPLTVRALVRDKQAAARSAERLLQWPISRIVVAHNTIIETNAYAQITHALRVFAAPLR